MSQEMYFSRMKELLNEEYDAYIDSLSKPLYRGMRVNLKKAELNEFDYLNHPSKFCKESYYVDKPLGNHPMHICGCFYLQEPSASSAVEILDVQENDYVLDLCAAPGGKSTQIASHLKKGYLVSNEIDAKRAQILLSNMERMGVKNMAVTNTSVDKLAKIFNNCFDKILVDAPCSGEGMFHKEPDLIKSWIEKDDTFYPPIQKNILNAAVSMLKPGGSIVYSTCTFSIHENEEVIQAVLDQHPDLHLMPIEKAEGMKPGINMEECVRLYPHKIKGEGHFVALLSKDGESKHKKIKLEPSDTIDDCVTDFLRLVKLNKGTIKVKKDKVIWLNTDFQAYKGYRVLRSGLLLGQLKGKHFEPSQSLALALCPEQFKNVLNFTIEDERVIKYLKGETLDVKDLDSKTSGWTLVCVNNFPLGFAKLSKGSLKNKYAKGWRYQ